MRRRFIALLFGLCAALLALAPCDAFAYSNTPADAIFVNGENITTDADHRIECGEGYAELDPDTGVLTLNNVTITKTYVNSSGTPTVDSNCGIYSGNGVELIINLVGENTMTCGIQAWGSNGTEPHGSITIMGTGSLEITSHKIVGINAYRDLTISSATVHAVTSSHITLQAQNGAVTIENGAHVEAYTSDGGLSGSGSYAIGSKQGGGERFN